MDKYLARDTNHFTFKYIYSNICEIMTFSHCQNIPYVQQNYTTDDSQDAMQTTRASLTNSSTLPGLP